jgi:hypothetical protein
MEIVRIILREAKGQTKDCKIETKNSDKIDGACGVVQNKS